MEGKKLCEGRGNTGEGLFHLKDAVTKQVAKLVDTVYFPQRAEKDPSLKVIFMVLQEGKRAK